MTRILVVDDEPQILRALRINLTARQHDVVTAPDGTHALESTRSDRPDIDGVEVIRSLRTWTPVPIVVLSGRVGSSDKVDALDAGADDYVTKPFSVDELLARIRAVTRRLTPPDAASDIHIGQFTLNVADRTVRGRDDPALTVHLTRTEWQLMDLFARNPGKLISQRQLLQEVWGPTYVDQTQSLRQYLTQLRRKLEDDPARPKHLLTEPGMGYRFQP